jgi:hypothetical protein
VTVSNGIRLLELKESHIIAYQMILYRKNIEEKLSFFYAGYSIGYELDSYVVLPTTNGEMRGFGYLYSQCNWCFDLQLSC